MPFSGIRNSGWAFRIPSTENLEVTPFRYDDEHATKTDGNNGIDEAQAEIQAAKVTYALRFIKEAYSI